jgi:hypothetical protein
MNGKDILDVVRKYWTSAPVDVFGILRELGLGPSFRPLGANISGAIERIGDDGFVVVINNTQSKTRQRFTAAHELGHYIYHRDLLGRGVGDTLAYRAQNTPFPNEHITVTHERQANNFAANLLMPNHLIEALKAEGVRIPGELAQRLGVSEAAMRIRLGLSVDPELFEPFAQRA